MAVVDQQSASHVLECMEIWGGNHAANAGASTPGLRLLHHASSRGNAARCKLRT